MERLVTAQQMRNIENNIIQKFGLPAVVLMERAALFAADRIMDTQQKGKVLIACGMGNNGADGMALARILAERGFDVSFVTVGDQAKRTELNKLQYHMIQELSVHGKVQEITMDALAAGTKRNPGEYAIIVDAILGIGVSRPLGGDFARLVRLLNDLAGFKLAMDIPTGIHTDTGQMLGSCFMADMTFCFGAVKTGLCMGTGKVAAGNIFCDSCGMVYQEVRMPIDDRPEAESIAYSMTVQDVRPFLGRSRGGNKGSFGKLGLIVGSRNVPGAAILASSAAYRSGAGYVRVLTQVKNRDLLMERMPEAVLQLYEEPEEAQCFLASVVSFADVLAVGCGIGTGPAQEKLLELLFDEILKAESGESKEKSEEPAHAKVSKVLILDADALTILARCDALLQRVRKLPCITILTPHMKEFERLCGKTVAEVAEDRMEIARAFARQHDVILVLKDAGTIVTDAAGRCMINRLGNDGMAVAGSGDVLCGIIASLLGQNVRCRQSRGDAFWGTCAAVTLHAATGDVCSRRLGAHGMLPQDMTKQLPEVILQIAVEPL